MADRSRADLHRFYIRLMRPIFQTTVLEVDASSEKEAVSTALTRAPELAEHEWRGQFDARSYSYDIQDLAGNEPPYVEGATEEDGDEPTEMKATARDLLPISHFGYLLLKAELFEGAGRLLLQPWFHRQGSLMIADLAEDWRDSLETIAEAGLAAYLDELREVAEEADLKRQEGSMTPFPPRNGQDSAEEDK